MAKQRGNHPSTNPLVASNRGFGCHSRIRKAAKLEKVEYLTKGFREAAELNNHEIQGERLFRWVLIVIALAFAAKVASAVISGEDFAAH